MKLVISSESLDPRQKLDVIQELIPICSAVEDHNLQKTIVVQGSKEQLIKAMDVFNKHLQYEH